MLGPPSPKIDNLLPQITTYPNSQINKEQKYFIQNKQTKATDKVYPIIELKKKKSHKAAATVGIN